MMPASTAANTVQPGATRSPCRQRAKFAASPEAFLPFCATSVIGALGTPNGAGRQDPRGKSGRFASSFVTPGPAYGAPGSCRLAHNGYRQLASTGQAVPRGCRCAGPAEAVVSGHPPFDMQSTAAGAGMWQCGTGGTGNGEAANGCCPTPGQLRRHKCANLRGKVSHWRSNRFGVAHARLPEKSRVSFGCRNVGGCGPARFSRRIVGIALSVHRGRRANRPHAVP